MWKISVAFIIVAASATFFITSSAYKQAGQDPKQRTFFDDTGKLHVMGIVLGQSTLRDAELAFRSRADAAVFLYPLPNKEGVEATYTGKLEAYFPSIADHSKVMLTLETTATELEKVRQRSSSPRIYPNGVLRMNLSSEDILAVKKKTILELILIPSVQLDEHVVLAQFGQAESIHKENDMITRYSFPKLGLTAIINMDGKDKLVFMNKP